MSELVSYAGKRVVITGAASGVGAALVAVVRDAGADWITAIDIRPGGPGRPVHPPTSPTPARSIEPSARSSDRSTCCSTTPAWRRPSPPTS
jgi:NAD(P)-dependent dehydrogenase (short-subunit alcohol dehydrogenase family)